ncbi:MAG: aromatic ring-hydroxylating dioxygenase subunit alpha [Acidimicrobiales bacterium]
MIAQSSSTSSTYRLGRDAYLSDAWHASEQREVFTRRWTLLSDLASLANPGDYVAATVGSAPLVVVRGDDGVLRAFHNLCRHRGMVMLSGSGNVGRTINCFYHQWRYATDGALEVVPQRREQFATLELGDWGLLPASVDVWEGMVFVHPDPAALPLADALGALPSSIGSHRPGQLVEVAHARIPANCNWKLLIENHVDVYHLWYLHAGSLAEFDHTRFQHRQLEANWVSFEPLRDHAGDGGSLHTGSAPIAHLDDRDRSGLGAHLLFPNTMMASSAEFFATYVAEPVAPDRTVIDLRIRAEADADGPALLASVRSFIDEDVAACEAVQRGLGSPAFSVGPMASEHEAAIGEFHGHLLEAMGA